MVLFQTPLNNEVIAIKLKSFVGKSPPTQFCSLGIWKKKISISDATPYTFFILFVVHLIDMP